jgi:hypothetical protein
MFAAMVFAFGVVAGVAPRDDSLVDPQMRLLSDGGFAFLVPILFVLGFRWWIGVAGNFQG